ncbi:unnamed protein product [Mesocestoides corti]|uniref:SANT domain-containing protein n=1 Tax=Mesocestoides corti TaxID=53468 RepID=A0A0R3UIA3_MESCO|nr:unnamed protein product [Mesocestoides corti]
MGEVHGLYYGIAAPFKAISRHNRRHGRQMQNCYEKALKCGFIPTPSSPQRQVVAPVLEDEEASVDSALERHLCDIVGWQQAGRLLADVRRGRPTASSSIINEGGGYRTLTFGRRFPGAATESLAASSDHSSSFCDSRPRMNKRGLPSGMHYDHEEFLKFVKTPPEELEKMREDELSKLAPVDNELKSLIKSVDAQIQGIFEGLEKFYPEGGFPNVSYRWTRLELALFVSALSKHGDDFAAIAQTLGTKSESFLRDFYNQYRSRFDLDTFIGVASKTATLGRHGEVMVAASVCCDPSPSRRHDNPHRCVGVVGMRSELGPLTDTLM